MLTNEQAKENLKKYGPNELEEGKEKKRLSNIFRTVQGFSCNYSDHLAVISGFLGDVESAIVIFVVITMNAILGTVQTVKAEQSLNSLKQLSAPDAKLCVTGS